MPQIKSAIKRVKITETKTAQNKMIKSEISTFIKKFKKAVADKNVKEAEELYKQVSSKLDSAASDNVIHKNNASRKKAHFACMLESIKA